MFTLNQDLSFSNSACCGFPSLSSCLPPSLSPFLRACMAQLHSHQLKIILSLWLRSLSVCLRWHNSAQHNRLVWPIIKNQQPTTSLRWYVVFTEGSSEVYLYTHKFCQKCRHLKQTKRIKDNINIPKLSIYDHSYVRGNVKYFQVIKNLDRFEICCLANICKTFSPIIIVMPNCFQQHCFPTYR